MEKDIRWKQRFENLQKAYLFLEKGVKLEVYDELQQAGLIQSFEFTFELSWKTIKDYLETEGMIIPYPREVLKEAFKGGLIKDGHLWIKMLDTRNQLSHTYNDLQAKKAVETVRLEYFPAIRQVYESLKTISEKKCTE